MSPVIIVKNKEVASIAEMNRLALKKIFEKDNLTKAEEALLEESIAQWPKKIDLDPEEKRMLRVILGALIENENGGFDQVREEIIKHQLNYKKVYDVGL